MLVYNTKSINVLRNFRDKRINIICNIDNLQLKKYNNIYKWI